jgi:AcrR family transcriptional regulator
VSDTSRSSSRHAILDGVVALIRNGGTVSLESAARAAGLTKPGLMYHFPTKEALMTGLVDHVVDGYVRVFRAHLPATASADDPDAPTPEQRLRAYVDWAFSADIDQSDLVVFTDPRLRDHLTARWTERLQEWVDVPRDLPPERRARLLAARLIADGSWFADASGVLPLTGTERHSVWTVARDLIGEAS